MEGLEPSDLVQQSPLITPSADPDVDCHDFTQLMPSWAYKKEVSDLAESPEFRGSPVPMGLCVGPAVPVARWAVALTGLNTVLLAILIFFSSRCTGRGDINYPRWVWSGFVIFVAIRSAMEIFCVRHATVPYIQVTGKFRILGCPASFKGWCIWAIFLSLSGCFDAGTDSMVMASALASDWCTDSRMRRVFAYAMSESVLSRISYVHLSHLILACWALTFLQLIYPLLTAIPRCGQHVDYQLGAQDSTGKKYRLQYTDMTGTPVNFGDALFMVAEAAGMGSIQSMTPWFPRDKEKNVRRQASKPGASYDPMRSLNLVRGELRRGLVRFGFVAVFENAVQMNFQVTLLALSRRLHKASNFEKRAFVSIVFCLICSIIRVVHLMDLLRFSREVQKAVTEYEEIKDSQDDLDHSPSVFRADVEGWTVSRELKLIQRYVICIWVIAGIFLGLLAYALVKLAAAYICEESVWNLIGGCVSVPDDVLKPDAND